MGNKDLETHVELTTQRSREGTSPLSTHGDSHAISEPDAQTSPQWCKKCQADVTPRGKGLCPRCGIFLRQNFVARRHPVNVLRREALLADLLDQFPPANILERSTCEHLAATLEQLEVMKPGSPDWQRLVQTAQTLSGALHDARLAREERPTDDYEDFTEDDLIERLEALLKYAHETRDLKQHIERTAAAEKAQSAPVAPTEEMPAPTIGPVSFVAPAEPVPPTRCPYCHQLPAACAATKTDRLEVWRNLHRLDPDEIARKNAEATAVMMMQVGKPPRW